MSQTKFTVKIDGNELSFEGSEDATSRQFSQIAAMLLERSRPTAKEEPAPGAPPVVEPQRVDRPVKAPAAVTPAPEKDSSTPSADQPPKDSELKPASFAAEELSPILGSREGHVFLRAGNGPRSEEDQVMLLIYGRWAIFGDPLVTSPGLARSIKESGIEVKRPDRVVAAMNGFAVSEGFKRGKKYGLTNKGVDRAEEIVVRLLSRFEKGASS